MNYLDIDKIRSIHFEHTSKCNLLCPQCARVKDGKVVPELPLDELTLDDYKKILTPELVSQLDKVFWCGNYGDSIASNTFLECLEWVKSTGVPKISVITNGSARNSEWWVKVAKILNGPQDRVTFSIDGFEDTNHLYRVNAQWHKLIENVKAFIGAGGKAHWDYLIFDHNIHQVARAKTFAKKIGFESISFKNTSRFVNTAKFQEVMSEQVTHRKGDYSISSKENKNKTKYEQIIEKFGSFNEYVNQTPINCKTKNEQNIFIDFQMKLWPCCWVGAPKHFHDKQNIQEKQLNKLLNRYSKDFNSLRKYSLEEVLEHDFYDKDLVSSWSNTMDSEISKLFTCGRTCGDSYEFSSSTRFNEKTYYLDEVQ
jgi:MoaA/NifB/PqqE/SkfB family radical SAM enzyme